MCLAIRASF